MTLVSEIITDAFRQGNMIAVGTTPTAAQQTETLRHLNRLVSSVFGNEGGELLTPFPLGQGDINRPPGYPWYGNSPPANWFVPKDQRLMLNLTAETTVYLHPRPDDGTRLGVVDTSLNLSGNPLTLSGNGRLIEGDFSLVLDEDGFQGEWFYRDDLGSWMRTTSLIAGDTFPFPSAFDSMFITMLAMMINPSYGRSIDDLSVQVLQRSRSQFRARYHITRIKPSEDGLLRGYWNTGWWNDYTYTYDPTEMFNVGYPF